MFFTYVESNPIIISDDEKIGNKRPNKEELTRGHVSSSSDIEADVCKELEQITVKQEWKSSQKKKNKRKQKKKW